MEGSLLALFAHASLTLSSSCPLEAGSNSTHRVPRRRLYLFNPHKRYSFWFSSQMSQSCESKEKSVGWRHPLFLRDKSTSHDLVHPLSVRICRESRHPRYLNCQMRICMSRLTRPGPIPEKFMSYLSEAYHIYILKFYVFQKPIPKSSDHKSLLAPSTSTPYNASSSHSPVSPLSPTTTFFPLRHLRKADHPINT